MLFNKKTDDMFEGTGLKPAGEKKTTENTTDSGISSERHLSVVILYTIMVFALSIALIHEKRVNVVLSEELTEKNKKISQQVEEIESLSTLVIAQQSKINATYPGVDVESNNDPGPGQKEFIGSNSNKSAAETPENSNNLTPDEYDKRMEELRSINRDENPGIDEPTPITESLMPNDSPAEAWPGPDKYKDSLGNPISPAH